MIVVSDRDLRQYLKIMDTLNAFGDEKLELATLIANLEFLVGILDQTDEQFEEKFYECITDLEVINTLELENQNVNSDMTIRKIENTQIQNESVGKLRHLVEEKIRQYFIIQLKKILQTLNNFKTREIVDLGIFFNQLEVIASKLAEVNSSFKKEWYELLSSLWIANQEVIKCKNSEAFQDISLLENFVMNKIREI